MDKKKLRKFLLTLATASIFNATPAQATHDGPFDTEIIESYNYADIIANYPIEKLDFTEEEINRYMKYKIGQHTIGDIIEEGGALVFNTTESVSKTGHKQLKISKLQAIYENCYIYCPSGNEETNEIYTYEQIQQFLEIAYEIIKDIDMNANPFYIGHELYKRVIDFYIYDHSMVNMIKEEIDKEYIRPTDFVGNVEGFRDTDGNLFFIGRSGHAWNIVTCKSENEHIRYMVDCTNGIKFPNECYATNVIANVNEVMNYSKFNFIENSKNGYTQNTIDLYNELASINKQIAKKIDINIVKKFDEKFCHHILEIVI